MNPASQLIEILSRNKRTAIIALIVAIIIATVILAVHAMSNQKPKEAIE